MSLDVDISLARAAFPVEVAFSAGPGITALFGRSGAGKTTILDAIAGLATPERGTIMLAGRPVFSTSVNLRPHERRVGYVFQDPRLFPHLTVAENLLFSGRMPGQAIAGIAEMLGITQLLDRRPAALSGGEKRRVAIGRALLSDPSILLLDEPLSGIDAERKHEIMPYLETMRERLGIPVLLVSHDIADVARLADTVILIDGGRITARGRPDALLSDAASADLLGAGEGGALLEGTVLSVAEGIAEVDTPAGRLRLPAAQLEPGRAVRVRIVERDVMLSLSQPDGLSALNALPGRVISLRERGTSQVEITLRCAEADILCRITTHSARRLGLEEGTAVFAVLKAVTLDAGKVFHRPVRLQEI
ncbi:MAG: molybdenum ABC transporter ATP-binding protein [Rubricella sp.]